MNTLIDNLGSRLRLARTLRGWSQQELAHQISVSRQFIHQLETGLKYPTECVFEAICESLGVRTNFFKVALVNELTSEQCNFRKRKTTTLSLASRVISFGVIFEELLNYLNTYIDFPDSDISEFSSMVSSHSKSETYSRQSIEDVADHFRKEYKLGSDTPIDNLTDLIENLGVFVTSFAGVSDKVDALSFSRKYHVILRNKAKESACRQRFDLAHELGHIILHQGIVTGEGATEAEADYFASSFLFPRKAFVKEFNRCMTPVGSFRWKHILELKIRWKVSQRAIIYRAKSLGLIDSRQYRSANVYLSGSGQAKRELLDDQIPMEEPSLISSSIDILQSEVGINFRKISDIIGIKPDYLAEMIGVEFGASATTENNVFSLPPRQMFNT